MIHIPTACQRPSQAARIDPNDSGFSASDLVHRGRRIWLIATPTVAPSDFYGGCLSFRLSSPDTPALRDRDADGLPDVVGGVVTDPGGFAGACGFSLKSRRAGLVLSRAAFDMPVRYHLVRTGEIP